MKTPRHVLIAVMSAILPLAASGNEEQNPKEPALESAIIGGGCFWCVEAQYKMLKGVKAVASGYAGGHVKNPTYKAVCEGTTGHAEVIKVDFDPAVVSFRDIIDLFWVAHDPTTLNRQGNDVGTQYRSIILYTSPEQKAAAEASLAEAKELYDDPIVTEITPLEVFYPAEDYHQDYFANNPFQGYCRAVVAPKVAKFREKLLEKNKLNEK
jgi:peptide-methionine (S)-S-oxide reductase